MGGLTRCFFYQTINKQKLKAHGSGTFLFGEGRGGGCLGGLQLEYAFKAETVLKSICVLQNITGALLLFVCKDWHCFCSKSFDSCFYVVVFLGLQ